MADDKLIFPIGFDLEEGVAKVEKDWGKMQKRLQDTFKSQTIQVDADISKAVLDKLYAKFEGLIKTMESKAPQIKLKMPDTVDFEQEINRLKVQLKSINLGELTDAESKDLYLYIRQLEALAKALKEVNKQEQLRQANNPANKALQEARAQEKLTRAKANDALAEQRRAKIATETARQNEINNRSAQRGAVIAEQKRAATARAEQAELRLTQVKERSTAVTERQNSAYKTQSGYLQRLAQRMIAYASVTQVFSFLRNIREVTAQFELQRVALGSIIGDLNEANAMFEQIKAAAVKSPFQIKELVSYTKQLAAYKIETDELFETTQKLADISAGLGVGMERLVLAYGQIRATGYLRASEVRQLTEAGIPIVEELAKKMSELRGETVSAAEVMGMISERAISFGMVKEVFDDMTSAGGMFYKMQEKQAETLAGQISNLKDSFAIMYDEIGRSENVNSTMKSMIGLVKSLAENWRDVWSVVQSLSAAMGVYYVAMKNAAVASTALTASEARLAALEMTREARMPRLIALMLGQDKAITVTIAMNKALVFAQKKALMATTALGKAFWKLTTAMLSNPYTAILAALAGITFAIVKFATKTKTTQERIDDLNKSVALLTDLKNDVKPLVDELDALSQKANKTAEEQKRLNQVTQELARIYPEAIVGVREFGSEVELSAEKIKELYEAERQAIEEGLKIKLQANEDELKKEEARLARLNKALVDKTYTETTYGFGGTSTTTTYKYTTEELNDLAKQADETRTKIATLNNSIKEGRIALGLEKSDIDKAVDSFNTWQKELASITEGKNLKGEGIRVFDDESIAQTPKLTSALEKVAEKYKKLKEEKKQVDKALLSEGAKADKQTYSQLEQRLGKINEGMSGLYDFLKKYGALDLIKSDDKGQKSAYQALKDELAAVEKIYKRYQDLRKLKSETDTQSILANEFKGVSLTTLSKAYAPEQMIAVYQKALAEAQRLGKKDLVLEIQTKIGEFNVAEEQRKLEKNLKKLSDDLSRTKTAKEFFDRMLGLTGDKQLSATLTMSVYGEGGEDLGAKLAKQTADAFKAKYKGVNFSETAISDKGVFDWDTILAEGKKQKGKFGTSEYDKFLDDVDAGRKASAKRLETLMNELEKTKTYSEKLVDIYTNTQERLNTIDQEVEDDAVRKRLKEQVKALQTKEMQKLQYESFKDSPMYVAMFENLDATSTAMLTNMRNHIVKLRDAWKEGLDPTQLKELQSRINEIDKQLATRNPFKGIVDGIKEMNALGNRKQDEQSLLDATIKKLEAERAYQEAVKSGKPSEEIERLAKKLGDCVEAENKAARKMSEWDDATRKVTQGMQNLQQVIQLVQTTSTAVNDIVEAFGGWGDAVDEEFWNTILDGINGLMSGVQSAGTGIAQIMAGDILGGVTSLVSGIGSIVSAIGDWIYADRIRQAEKEIERQQEIIDNLAYSYERLEKTQEKAFGSDYISNYEQRLANLQAQADAYQKQADAERLKGKKADADKIKEYEEQARAATDAIKDMQSELSEYFLGSDLTSAARDFANAWIEAYKEFGSTTDAMKEKFQDMIQNMIVESFAAKVIQSALSDIFTEIDNMTKDGVLDMSEASKITDMTEVAVGNIDVGMTNLMNALSQAGISVRGMGSDLTGISRDIATASEESILGLAAGINTQNFYISQVPPKLDVIIGLLQGGNLAQGSAITLQDLVTIQNQHLSYLPSIAQHTAETVAECKRTADACEAMVNKLNSVIKPQGTEATHRVATILSNK